MPTSTYIGEPLRVIEVIPVERPVPDPLPIEVPAEDEPVREPDEVPAGERR